ncbi:Flp family type IVb pilin [Pseudomonas sp. 32A]|uniref:Flp family type IVb pilin n=1 Tax=Pseudomonas sp. 32A TaxID=651185 RepID=UPI00404675E5
MFANNVLNIVVKMQSFVSAREGASGIEYAIVAAMCAAVIGIFMSPISERAKALFNVLSASITST